MQRERFSSRLGFLLISAGCAIGLGNVWRFPYMVGQNGGAIFVLFYLIFLLILGLPIMVMEFAVGRASRKSAALSFRVLEPKGSKWHWHGWAAMVGNYLLMMFYTTIAGSMLSYFAKMLSGSFSGLDTAGVAATYSTMVQQPAEMVFWMVAVVLIGNGICSLGLQNGVERITKWMMSFLFVIMLVLCVRAVTLEGASEGLRFYLLPDFSVFSNGNFMSIIVAAMGQAFFTLSIGIGSMAIFGSYIGKERTLTGEAIGITILDTLVAFMSGLIIFPACFAFGVQPDSGPNLIFVTLPNVFNTMPGGNLWGGFFFLFLSFAALSTVVAVFENILSFSMDLWGFSRKKAVLINVVLIIALSLPVALESSLLSGVNPLGMGSFTGLWDFIVSNHLLPLGSLVYLLFCTTRYGWGWDNFMAEANSGKGLKFPRAARFYVTFIIPFIVIFIFLNGYFKFF
ncbi:MAG: sodium-dependent transporter [Angelakisella sp.]